MTTKITNKNFSSVSNIGVSWQSVIVADGSTATTGVAGLGYFINTTSAAHTFTLPAIATAGDTISIKDYAGTFSSNKLTINRNGHNIQGVANDSLIQTNRASVTLVYIDGTRGWEFTKESNVADLQVNTFISATGGTVTTSGNFKIHSFTGDGCFVVATIGVGPAGGPSNVDYLVVAGGGGGGRQNSGGGGAGGYRTTFPSPGCNAGSFTITSTTFPITVGGGGAGGNSPTLGVSGTPSIFSTITSTGGGGGGANTGGGGVNYIGRDGGSGGGGASDGTNIGAGGAGNTPPVSPSQGNPGGSGFANPVGPAGGGGGAGATGGTGTAPAAGSGGAGLTNSITGSPATYAGGGGGAINIGTVGSGGSGGGGAGGKNSGPFAVTGTINTGGGGGGAADGSPSILGANGGSGIVIIRYKFQ